MARIYTSTEAGYATDVAAALVDGGLAVIPTDTVYGLAASAFSKRGLERLYEISGRPEEKPLALLIDNISWVSRLTEEVPEIGYALMTEFWPGALTLVFRASGEVPRQLAPLGKVGLRFPGSENAIEIIEMLGAPLATKSANFSGGPTPEDFEDLDKSLLDRVEVAVKGDILLQKASTVLDISEKKVKIIREGVISKESLEGVLREKL